METVLVIDDDRALCDTLGVMLEREGFEAVLASDGRSGFERAIALNPRLILVDLRMPHLSGTEVCKRLRARGMETPLIVLSASAGEIDKVQLLDIGADDYVVKPFGVRELLARIRAVLRRTAGPDNKVLEFGSVKVDVTRRVVERDGQQLRLTRAEYNLLTHFLQNPDRVLTRETILNSVWGYDFSPQTRTVDAHVVRLRQKLEPNPGAPRYFLTVHGVGYRFVHQPENSPANC
ncbi:MAG TPA: response regulator transcription factor [Bryobacteraceae bacterium]|nr:response regulator transcription factor [Bryobacteraceae bacterium]